ncbi:hypothetical protein [Microbispora sp. H10885]|nr:hypothetical protein [Microbispora sp. H10885]
MYSVGKSKQVDDFGDGGSGMVTYLIVEYRRLVEIIHVAWYG